MITFGEGNLRIPRFEKPVYIVAGGMTDFRKKYPEKATEESRRKRSTWRFSKTTSRFRCRNSNASSTFVYSQFADHFGDQLLAAARVHDALGFDPLGNIEVKTGGATGGHAVLAGAMVVASGYADVVPVVGWERMDEVPTKQGNSYIASAACKNFESELGWIYASYYALMAQRYLYENQVPRETLAKIAVKNHRYACSSPFSQNPMKLTEKEVLENPMVSDPLSFLECCVMSTGAAALVLADEKMAYKLTDRPVRLTAIFPAPIPCARRTGGRWTCCACLTSLKICPGTAIGTGRGPALSWPRAWRRTWPITWPASGIPSRSWTSWSPTTLSPSATFKPTRTSACGLTDGGGNSSRAERPTWAGSSNQPVRRTAGEHARRGRHRHLPDRRSHVAASG